MRLDEAKIETLRTLIAKSERIVVVSHVNPDGDAIGSSLGMCAALQKQGKSVDVLLPTVYPDYYVFLPNADNILVGEKERDTAHSQGMPHMH